MNGRLPASRLRLVVALCLIPYLLVVVRLAYIQIIDDTTRVVPVPETGYTFNELITAQAAGDRAALADRNRTLIAVDLGADITAGLTAMSRLLNPNF